MKESEKILGIGNALVDMLTPLDDDAALHALGFARGSMHLVGREVHERIERLIGGRTSHVVSGGSAANTLRGLARLGVATGYIGKIGRDPVGAHTEESLRSHGIASHLIYSDTPSGRCMVLIDPTGERTMATYLGAAVEMGDHELDETAFAGYGLLHIEGYLVQNRALIEGAMVRAKQLGMRVSLDMASFNVVCEHRDFLGHLLREYVDVVFANEDEARSFAECDPEEALAVLAGLCDVAVVKLGRHGSVIGRGAERWRIAGTGTVAVDTTGAGDLYATGFLYGMSRGWSLELCGRSGSLVADRAIRSIGPAVAEGEWEELRAAIERLTVLR